MHKYHIIYCYFYIIDTKISINGAKITLAKFNYLKSPPHKNKKREYPCKNHTLSEEGNTLNMANDD